MKEIKDTVRSRVRIAYDGSVHKTFHGTNRQTRYATEVRVLRHLEAQGCDFVPRLLDCDDESLHIVTSNCGQSVAKLSGAKTQSLFDELEQFGVRHGDQAVRNITYDSRRGRFCVIDFESADILDEETGSVGSAEDASDTTGSGFADEPNSEGSAGADKSDQGTG